MNWQLRVLTASLLLLPLAGCDYLPAWVPGAKSGKAAAKTPKQDSTEELSVEQQILQLQQEIQAVEEEKQKLEQRRTEIQNEKETLSEILQEQEADLERKERELKRQESAASAGG
jgi:septal ring factor EnvC (AmiA/AmiB activator)